MRYNPDYTISLPDGQSVPLLFNSWTFRKYTDFKGIEFYNLIEGIQKGELFRSTDIPELLGFAAESFNRFNGLDLKFEPEASYTWIDGMGGFNSPKLLDVYKIFVSKALGIPVSTLDQAVTIARKEQEAPVQKKTRASKVSHGMSST